MALLFRGGGGMMDSRAMIAGARSFDVVVAGAPHRAVSSDTEVIPSVIPTELVRHTLRDSSTHLVAAVDLCRRMEARRITLLAPPPPLPGAAVRDRLGHGPVWPERLAEMGVGAEDVPLVPDGVRHRLWLLSVSAYRDVADELGVEFIAPPAEAQDPQGMLREEFWRDHDAVHANGAYGTLYLQKVRSWATEERA